MPRKVILDVDPGVDDALGVCLALGSPNVEVIALTATGGNVLPEQATRNVQALVEQLDPARWPRIGAADPEQALNADGRDLHGVDGLGGALFEVAELAKGHPSVKLLLDEVRQAPGEVTLVCMGPLTNLATALQREPEVALGLGQVLIVGGTHSGPGDVTAAAEFNFFCDAEAARAVLRSRLTKTLLPLDVTRTLVMRYDLLDLVRSRSNPVASLLDQMLPGFYRAHRQRLGMEGVLVHDAIGVVMAIHPELFITQPMYGDVEVSGELTHGACVLDRRPLPESQPNLEVVVEMDTAAVRDCLLRMLGPG